VRDPVSYNELFAVPLGVSPLAGVMTSNGEALAAGSPGRVDLIDLTTPTWMSVSVTGLTSAIALGPFDEIVYVASDTGTFIALDLETGVEAWSLATLPVTTYEDLVVAPDGAYAYACLPLTGEVLEIDLVNRTVGRTFAVPGANALDIAFTRHHLAVTNGVGGGVHVVDLVTGTVGAPIATGPMPSDVVFADDDAFLLVANAGFSDVTLIDALTSTPVTSIPVGPGPVSVTAGRDELGVPYGIAVTLGDPFALPLPTDPVIAVFPVTDTLPILVDTYPLLDEPAFVVVNGR